MAGEDLAVRERLAGTGELFDGYNAEMRAVHRRNGDRLAVIIDEVGCWPGNRLVGKTGSWAAFIIAQHDIANPTFMRHCRDLYASAVDEADADPTGLACLEDRIRMFEGRLQRYGTHWGWNEDGRFGPWPPVEEPHSIDERRSKLGLPPLAEALQAAQAGRPEHRPVDKVRNDHIRAEEFAKQTGWRT